MNKQYTQRKPAVQYREDRPTKGDRRVAIQQQRTSDKRMLRKELQSFDRTIHDELEAIYD